MDAVLNWGLELIIIIQKARSPFLDRFFLAVTSLGSDFFYLLILPLLYWCVDKKHSLRLFFLFMFSSWLNSTTKDFLNQPRPYALDSQVKVGSTGGPGIPSGHAQGSLVLWGYLALWARRRWFTLFCIAIILLIAFSRLYLGVHFPTDLLGGWALGLLLLLPFNALADRLEPKLAALSFPWKLALCTLLPVLMSFVIPSKWSVRPMGLTAGFSLAVIMEMKHFDVGMPGNTLKGLARYLVGILGILIIYFGAKLFIDKDSLYYLPLIFAQYYVTGLWMGLAAPYLFRKLGLEIKPDNGG
jgi:membrane-associated phospholipid phosphatase